MKALGKRRADGREVYIVTDGSYSDYRIIAVFGDRDSARALTALNGGQIETWALTGEPSDLVWWYAFVDENGDANGSPTRTIGRDAPPPSVLTKNFTGGVLFRGLGRDPEGALKSARDVRTKWQAERAFLTGCT